jgi:hypothetical protein
LHIRQTDVKTRRNPIIRCYYLNELTAFNEDRFDGYATNMQTPNCIHLSYRQKILFQCISNSGVSYTIGSIYPSAACNITFRYCVINHTFQGTSLKPRPEELRNTGQTSDMSHENIQINNAS